MDWFTPLLMTGQLMLISVAIASIIGFVGAWAGSSLDRGGFFARQLARVFFAAILITTAMPMILHATAWEATAGKFGWWMLTQTGVRTNDAGVYGFFAGLVAAGWIHGVVGGAIVAIAAWSGVKRVSPAIIRQSQLDFGPNSAFWSVLLPIAAPWWIASLIATAALAATEMTVVDLYGVQTVADRFYLYYAMDPTTESILATCFVPLVICLMVLLWLFVSRRRVLAMRSRTVEVLDSIENASVVTQLIAAGTALIIASTLVVVPMSGLLSKIGQDVVVENGQVLVSWSAWTLVRRLAEIPSTFTSEYHWTAILAALTASASIGIAWPIAAIARNHRRMEAIVDAGSIAFVCVPGPIVGLTVVRLFQFDLPGLDWLYQQTLLPTTLALLVRSGPVAYWILRSAYRGIDSVVFEAASLELGWWRRMVAIDFPLVARSLTVAWLATAIFSSGDLPAMLPVLPAGVSTVGVRLFGLLHSGARYQEASLAIGYLVAVALFTMICLRLVARKHAKVEQ